MLGLKVRENYECPAAVVLIKAHKALEALVSTQKIASRTQWIVRPTRYEEICATRQGRPGGVH